MYPFCPVIFKRKPNLFVSLVKCDDPRFLPRCCAHTTCPIFAISARLSRLSHQRLRTNLEASLSTTSTRSAPAQGVPGASALTRSCLWRLSGAFGVLFLASDEFAP